ncbi:PQQ-dependent sugar dehydrogenase [Mucilaginibacter hurinus]|uniref:PQQ-dependent sugar dehydrogenase n=1 Tax=Mucilaginibacter hurinus TaxID=2201324 RepID=UPI001313D8BD|nr:PQQ-dependent sugar dehydrogenase [Mucilaginibacter hurinus]
MIISSPVDHGYGTHMYEHEGKLLAKCLEQTSGVEAVTSYGWPKDPAILKDVKGLVFYSKSAFDLMMADSVSKIQANALFDNKVGFSCIHMSTLSTDDKMIDLLGARWYFKQLQGERLNLDVRMTDIVQTDPGHPVSRGWKDFKMRDEIYLSTIFHPKAKPLVKAEAFAGDEVVAWTFNREKGGRSFGTTLGHFHQTFRTESFRKLLVNGILWTVNVKIPKEGAPVDISKKEDILPPNPRAAAIAAAEPVDESRFEKQVLVPACNDPMQMAVRGNGDVYFIERNGKLRLYEAKTKEVKTLGSVPVYNHGEVGLLGFALDGSFDKTGWLYLFFCPAENNTTMRLSRFALKDGRLDLQSEKKLLDYAGDTNNGHQGGGLHMCFDGSLLIGTGDNTNHMLELPVDQRVGFEKFDALRTSANTNSLRGKILRIRPMPDGTYTIPAGNLFGRTDSTRAEIFAMGVRNGFRVVDDFTTGFIYWGDVGQNVDPGLGIGPNSYDEINQARNAGNFGWPMFTGPNEAYRAWDFAAKKPGALFNVNAPRNQSRNNTGMVALPKPVPAFIYYPSTVSKKFPTLGSGGRSAMVGPVYHWAEIMFMSDVMMPAAYDNSIFIYDWMRNWIQVVKLDWNGEIREIVPFMPSHNWRKPIDLKLGADNSLYVAEMGDSWENNQNSQISRVIYRRGNRPPVAALSVTPKAGKNPLHITFDATTSYDKDVKDALTYKWKLTGPDGNEIQLPQNVGAQLKSTLTKKGIYVAEVTVVDNHGASAKATLSVPVGREAPQVRLIEPENGDFYDLGQKINYQVAVKNYDKPKQKQNAVPPDVTVSASVIKRWMRNTAIDELEDVSAGLQLMRQTTCFSCHQVNSQSIGPAYTAVAAKYAAAPGKRDELAKKILSGGSGVWGNALMPPHPQHSLAEARQMVNWILYMSHLSKQTKSDITNYFTAPNDGLLNRLSKSGNVLAISAVYNPGQGSNAEVTHVLRSRLQKAVNYSAIYGARVIEDFDSGEGKCVQFDANNSISFQDVNLKGIVQLKLRMQKLTKSEVTFEARAGQPNGQLIGSVNLPNGSGYQDVNIAVKQGIGLHDIFLIAKSTDKHAVTNLSSITFEAVK